MKYSIRKYASRISVACLLFAAAATTITIPLNATHRVAGEASVTSPCQCFQGSADCFFDGVQCPRTDGLCRCFFNSSSCCEPNGALLSATTCRTCDGSGQQLSSCAVCGGDGVSSTGNACQSCAGSGQRYIFCRTCGGDGTLVKEDGKAEAFSTCSLRCIEGCGGKCTKPRHHMGFHKCGNGHTF